MKIGTKLTAGFVFIACFVGLVGYIGLNNMNAINQGKTGMYEENLIPLTLLAQMEANTLSNSRDMETVMYTEDEVNIIIIRDRVAKRANENAALLEQLKATQLSPEEIALIEKYEQKSKEYDLSRVQAIDLAVQRNFIMARFENKQGSERRTEIELILMNLRKLHIEEAQNSVAASEAAFTDSSRAMLAITGVCLALAVLLGILLSRNITRSVKKGVEFAEALAEGRLDKKMNVNSKDELGYLAAALNKAALNMREMLHSIIGASESLNKNSQELSAAVQEIASQVQNITLSTQEIAAEMETTSAATEEMNASGQEISNSARQLTNKAEEGSRSAMSIEKRARELNKNAYQSREIAQTLCAQQQANIEK
ncbi:MAG: methyl-accepting chemotaxis protein, partial [Clostridia bacterium]|nr:methyl-accepting chemotaxis protein [Clostridia bacterium]